MLLVALIAGKRLGKVVYTIVSAIYFNGMLEINLVKGTRYNFCYSVCLCLTVLVPFTQFEITLDYLLSNNPMKPITEFDNPLCSLTMFTVTALSCS